MVAPGLEPRLGLESILEYVIRGLEEPESRFASYWALTVALAPAAIIASPLHLELPTLEIEPEVKIERADMEPL